MITTVTIDFWNTLVDTGNGAARRAHRHAAMRAACVEAGVAWDEAAADAAIREASEEFERRWFGERRTMTAGETLEYVWRRLGIIVSPAMHDHVRRAFEESILVGMPALLDGAAETLARLAERYRLAVISDTAISPGSMLRSVLERHGVARHFTAMVFSDETGVAKPHPRAFETALAACGARAGEAVHIGDIERTDIAGAKQMRMRAILFEGDAGRQRYNDGEGTAADARAGSWWEIPDIIVRLNTALRAPQAAGEGDGAR